MVGSMDVNGDLGYAGRQSVKTGGGEVSVSGAPKDTAIILPNDLA